MSLVEGLSCFNTGFFCQAFCSYAHKTLRLVILLLIDNNMIPYAQSFGPNISLNQPDLVCLGWRSRPVLVDGRRALVCGGF